MDVERSQRTFFSEEALIQAAFADSTLASHYTPLIRHRSKHAIADALVRVCKRFFKFS